MVRKHPYSYCLLCAFCRVNLTSREVRLIPKADEDEGYSPEQLTGRGEMEK